MTQNRPPYECVVCGLEYGDRGSAAKCCSEIPLEGLVLTDGGVDPNGVEPATGSGHSKTYTDRFRYVLVGCGGQKRDCRNTLAYNLYTSGWFRWNRAYALWLGDFYSVLSAKGVIPWIAYIEPYDLRITKSGFEGETEPNHDTVADWADHVADHVDETIHYHSDQDSIEIVVLHAQSYVNPLRDRLADVAADYETVDVAIRFPFDDTGGNGQQMRWAREQVAAERGVDPDDLELNALFCDACERAARNAEVYPPGEVTSPGNGMAPEWWTADGAWLCESCRKNAKGEARPTVEVKNPDPTGNPPDAIQSTFTRFVARTDGGETPAPSNIEATWSNGDLITDGGAVVGACEEDELVVVAPARNRSNTQPTRFHTRECEYYPSNPQTFRRSVAEAWGWQECHACAGTKAPKTGGDLSTYKAATRAGESRSESDACDEEADTDDDTVELLPDGGIEQFTEPIREETRELLRKYWYASGVFAGWFVAGLVIRLNLLTPTQFSILGGIGVLVALIMAVKFDV